MGSETEVFRKMQSMVKEMRLTYQIEDNELESDESMNIDSLEFMALLIEAESRFGLAISDEVTKEKKLKVIKNLAAYIAAHQPRVGNS